MTAEQILVVILASALAVFLVLAIVLTVILIKIAKRVQMIIDSAQRTVDHVEGFVANAQKAVNPTVIGSYVVDWLSSWFKRNKR